MMSSELEKSEFETHASGKRRGLLGEFWGFLKENRNWWLLPIVVMVLLLGALVVLGGTAWAPFIYTLF